MTITNAVEAVVALDEMECKGGKRIGVARLNSEKTLNSLSLEMIELLGPALLRWRNDPQVAAVVLHGAGERAFCAGGDIQALYRSITRNHAAGHRVDAYAETFFEAEYRLDHLLHTYPKPVITYGHGIVMGGGLGLFSASRFRLVTAKSRIALPEVTIGLFPDAGATWILKSMKPAEALFFGATGSHMNGADALRLSLATHAVVEGWPVLLNGLKAIPFSNDERDAERIGELLESLRGPLPDSPLAANADAITQALPNLPASAAELGVRLGTLAGRNEWLDRALATLRKGCPTSVGIVLEQVRRAPALSLADSFRLEMTVATHCARNRDFAEGVRALLIDKDNAPKWQYPTLEALPAEHVAAHFEPPWPANPLANLEEAQ